MDKEIYKKLYKEADDGLANIVEEFSASRDVLQNDQRFVMTRLTLAFSFLEVLCNQYNAYNNLHLTNRPLMEKWLEEYCLVDRNPTYRRHPYIKMLTKEHLYKFRNSVIHAFGLPELENGISITSPNGSETDISIKIMDEELKKRGHSIAFISADALVQLFIDGFKLMHPEIFKDVSVATQSDLLGLDRIVKEFFRRGAKSVSLV